MEEILGRNVMVTIEKLDEVYMRVFSDATLQILGGNNQTVQLVQFVDMFPITIDSLMFASTNTDVQYLVGNATFRYGYYKFL